MVKSIQRSKWISSLLLISMLFPLPKSQASLSAKQEGERFLAQIPSTPLADLQDRLRVRAQPVPKTVVLQGREELLGQFLYEGESFPYAIQGAPGQLQKISSSHSSHSRFSLPHPPHGLKRFAIFAHCVVRAFYLVRFEANNDPDDPLDPEVPPDPLCPLSEQTYLKRAERFSEWFFHLS